MNVKAAVVLSAALFASLLAFGCLDFFRQPAPSPSPVPPGVIEAATPAAAPAIIIATPTPTPAAVQEKQLEVEFKEIPPSGCLTAEDKQELSEVTPITGGIRVRQGFLLDSPCWTVSASSVQKNSLVSVVINATPVTPPREAVSGVMCIQCIAVKTIEANVSIAPGAYSVEVVLLRGGERKVLVPSREVEVSMEGSAASAEVLLAPPAPWVKNKKPPRDAVFERPRKKISATVGVAGAPGFEGAGAFAPDAVVGTRNITALLVQFPGDRNHSTNGCGGGECTAAYFSNLLFGAGNSSLRAYYYENSYGQLNITGSVYGWLNLTRNMSYYGEGSPGTDALFCALLNDSVVAADSSVDFSCYPNCTIMVVHAGNGEESSAVSTDIWSVSVSGCSAASVDGVSITAGIITPETEAGGAVPFGVMAHEYAHALGAPDLYDTSTGDSVVGDWDLMDYGSWKGSPSGSNPTHLSAWNKILLGWVTPYVVNYSGSKFLTLLALASNASGTKIIKVPSLSDSSQEYFLIENRQNTAGVFDAAAPEAGVLIWHVDDSIGSVSSNDINNYTTKRVIPEDQNLTTGGDPRTGLDDAAFTAGQAFNSTTSPNSSKNDGNSTSIAVYRLASSGTNYTLAVNNNDTIAPSTVIAAPQNSSTYFTKTNLAFNYSATDLLGVEWVGYSLDGAANVTLAGNTTFNVSQDGLHNATLYANDSAGNRNYSIVFFSVNSTPPQYYNLSATPDSPASYSPTQAYFFNSTWIGVVGNVSTVLLEFNGTNYTATNYSAEVLGGKYYVNLTGLNAGNYSYRWYANDIYGNLNATPAANYTVNLSSTTLSQTASPASPEINGTNVTFTCNYSSNGSLVQNATVYVNLDGANYTATETEQGYVYYNSTLSLNASLSSTNHSWYCIANKTNYESKITTAENYTVAKLVVKLSAPANGSTYSHNISTLNFSFIQRHWLLNATNCSLYLNGVLNKTNSSTAHNATTFFNVSSFPLGNNSWYVNCIGSANETGVSESRVFAWTNNLPSLTNVTSSRYFAKNGSAVNITSDALASDADNDSFYLRCGNSSRTYNLCNGSASYGVGVRACDFTWPYSDDVNHTIYCSLYDGFNASGEVTVNITSDNTAPAINSSSAVPNSSFKGRIYRIYANVTEADQLTTTQAVIKLPDGTNTTQNLSLSDGLYYYAYYTYNTSLNGTYYVDLNFSDAAGNVNYFPNALSFAVSNVSASVNVTASATTVCTSDSITLSGWAVLSNGSGVGYGWLIVLGGVASGSAITSSEGYYSANVIPSATGSITVSLNDTTVNTSVSVTLQACPTPSPTPTPIPTTPSGGGGAPAAAPAPERVASVEINATPTGGVVTIFNSTANKSLEIVATPQFANATDLLRLNITLTSSFDKVVLRVEKIDAKSANVTEPKVNDIPAVVYKYLNITKENFEDKDVKSAGITFRVEKAWLSEKRAKPEDVSLARFNETTRTWTFLPTQKTLELADYYEFRAITPGFSVFAVVVKQPPPSPSPSPSPLPSPAPSPVPSPTPSPTPSPAPALVAGVLGFDWLAASLFFAAAVVVAALVVLVVVLPKFGVKIPFSFKALQATFSALRLPRLLRLPSLPAFKKPREEQQPQQLVQQSRQPAQTPVKPEAQEPLPQVTREKEQTSLERFERELDRLRRKREFQ